MTTSTTSTTGTTSTTRATGTTPATPDPADAAVKARHATMWGLGDYAAVARDVIPELGSTIVDAAGVARGDRVLDVAAGTGNATLPAARIGARVVAADLAPALVDVGRRATADAGLDVEWHVADAEALPFPDASFDVVLSCVGVMFAPHHERSSAELLRVTRPEGRIALLSWTPSGFIGRLFGVMKPFAPPPPPGASPAPLWGDESHVRSLLGDGVTGVEATRALLDVRFDSPEAFRDFFKTAYGPTVATYRSIAEDADRVAALDAGLADLAREATDADGLMRWEYLLLTARRAG
ncbi:class I SAM-dependent methyltransferase [Intrasporangium flavum]|uniref:class I SAM-dependent methyltransferase n=1 Tax=Intrasporangium flavum TaxID=1428657 RepID=UPI0009FA0E68|nr:class I SAM-dependent methyltransferase [Intrasporangium flavum]